MNERFKQLQRLAFDAAWNLDNDPNGPGTHFQPNGFEQKFAELIVAECGNWFNSRLVVEPDYGLEHRIERNRAVVGVMKEFNQHFGVEL